MSQNIYDVRANVFKALAHPTRLKIIELLGDHDEICVCDIARKLSIEQPTISKHLSVLKNAGIVSNRKDGLMVLYKLRMKCCLDFFSCVDTIIFADIKKKTQHLKSLSIDTSQNIS